MSSDSATLIIKDLTLHLPDGRPLFTGLNATFSRQFTGIVGPLARSTLPFKVPPRCASQALQPGCRV